MKRMSYAKVDCCHLNPDPKKLRKLIPLHDVCVLKVDYCY